MTENRQVILDSLVSTLNKTVKGHDIIDIVYNEVWETIKIVYIDDFVFEASVGTLNGIQLIEEVIKIVKNKRD